METKKARLAELQTEINRMAAEIAHKMIGTVQRVLVEKVSRKSAEQVSGRTENNRPVNFTGGADLIGKFVEVEITEALYNSLRGRYVRTVDERVVGWGERSEPQQKHSDLVGVHELTPTYLGK